MTNAAVREAFEARMGFTPDPFQTDAFDALDKDLSVLVAAPTSSGKTLVAEYAVARAMAEGGKVFYTTPIKALSNQKFGDLGRAWGRDNVGLLTGDNSINPDAPIVVMTTEVLRNMIYAGSPALANLRYVVLDEVHYLQNAYRGPVWEEVIIHLPPAVDLVCLSATVSNAEEFADWISTVRGHTQAIIEERRPVELTNYYLVGDRNKDEPVLLPTFVNGEPNRDADALDHGASQGRSGRPAAGRSRGRLSTPTRVDVVEMLAARDMLPAISFIFSRNQCDEAVRQCLAANIRLTTPEERGRIRAIAEARTSCLSDKDLEVLGYGEWLHGLENGVAAHHAGMVPPFKEAVEACFAEALVKVVFATETLALGINMPARTVVIEKLTKFTGEKHDFLTPGEYTQLTGRAGRRGIDSEGNAVVLWSPYVPFDQVANLASARSFSLTSAFRPTYNMAANLIRRYRPDTARHLLNLSFAQFRSDDAVVHLETELQDAKNRYAQFRTRATSGPGDIDEYLRILAERDKMGRGRTSNVDQVNSSLGNLRVGDILAAPHGGPGGRVIVVAIEQRKGATMRVRVLRGTVTDSPRADTLGAKDFELPPNVLAHVNPPAKVVTSSRAFLLQMAQELRDADIPTPPDTQAERPGRGKRAVQSQELMERLAAHECSTDANLVHRIRAAQKAGTINGEVQRIERSVRSRSDALARQFDRVLRVMEERGLVDEWKLTESGERLASLYHESDLLVVEAMDDGLFDGLDPASLAAMASAFVFEERGPGVAPVPKFPSSDLADRMLTLERLHADLELSETAAGINVTRRPDPGFTELAYRWTNGRSLEKTLSGSEVSPGDFVRNVKQLVDLVRQIGDVAPDPATRLAARAAVDNMMRDVVAASTMVDLEAIDAAGNPGVRSGTLVPEPVVEASLTALGAALHDAGLDLDM